MNAKPEETVFVGDDLNADILGATEYGMKALWTWAFREEINGDTCPLSKDICVAKTREEYFKFLSAPNEYLNDKFNKQ